MAAAPIAARRVIDSPSYPSTLPSRLSRHDGPDPFVRMQRMPFSAIDNRICRDPELQFPFPVPIGNLLKKTGQSFCNVILPP